MKLQNEEVVLSAKHFKPWSMNSTDQQSETSEAICIIQLAIVYSVLTLT